MGDNRTAMFCRVSTPLSAIKVLRVTSRWCGTGDEKFSNWLRLLNNNKQWAEQQHSDDPTYFERLAAAQKPPFLYIGCADSRLPLTVYTKSGLGEFFVHRNVANQVSMNDMNFLASLEYSVNVLKVKHIVVAGHYNCGGVRAAVTGTESGVIGNWVQPIRKLYLQNLDVLKDLPEPELLNKLSELNVVQQVHNVLTTKVMMDNIFQNPRIEVPTVHGIVIDLANGLMKELPIPLNEWIANKELPPDFDNNGYTLRSVGN